VSNKKPGAQTEIVADLLRYAQHHNIDLLALLLALCFCEGVDEPEADEAEPLDVLAHYYPH
jgi:hypothetical protein